MLEGPVAVGDDDMGELESLGFMDGDDTDALELIALDGLGGDGVGPGFEEERGEVRGEGRGIAEESSELIEESADVCALVGEGREGENEAEALCEFVEGEGLQF